MWQERQAKKLREEIAALLAPLSDTSRLYNLVKESLTKDGRGLATEGTYSQPWLLLPLMVCGSISGHYERALPAAAVLQLLVSAGDVFDDIEDADSSESLSARYGSAIATNVATTLLILAERGITRLKARDIEDCIIVQVMDTVNSFYTTACVGQHFDLSLSSEMSISEETYLRIVSMKSASQIECACQIGAVLASANRELINTFTKFGYNLGMAAQITNDILGITSGSDILKHKITLPVIYALAQTDGETRNQLKLVFGKQLESAVDAMQIRELMFHTGAINYATIKMEFCKQRALDNLFEAEQAGASIEQLKLFLE